MSTIKAMLITLRRDGQDYEFWREASQIFVHSNNILGYLKGVIYPYGSLLGDAPIYYGGVSTKEFRAICSRWLDDRLLASHTVTNSPRCEDCTQYTIRRTVTGEPSATCLCGNPIHGYYPSCAYMREDGHECGKDGKLFISRRGERSLHDL